MIFKFLVIFCILQKVFIVGLAIIAAVSADVSHLAEKGYNYPEPNPSFHDELSQPIAPPPRVSVCIINADTANSVQILMQFE